MVSSIRGSSLSASEATLWRAIDERRTQDALKQIEILKRDHPTNADVWHLISQALYKLGQLDGAFKAVNQSLRLSPSSKSYLQAANIAVAAADLTTATKLLEAVRVDELRTVYELDTAARISARIERFEAALALYQRALLIAPTDADLNYSAAAVSRFLGNSDEARAYLEAAKKARVAFSDAYLLDSGLRKKSLEDNQISDIDSLLARKDLSPKQRVELSFAKAKEHEDLGQYEKCAETLVSANALRRRHMNYSAADDVEVMSQLRQKVTKDYCLKKQTSTTLSPVFIAGLPRTGSTLLERMLVSNNELSSIGESNVFPNAIRKSLPELPRSKAELLKALPSFDSQLASGLYARHTGLADSRRTLDKLPMNFLNVGLILAAFPRAKIIITKRSPLDTIYAIFKTLFEDAHPYAYDLAELTQYYIAYHHLIEHWKRSFPDSVIEVAYEDLVADTDKVLQQLCAVLDIEYTSAMPDGARIQSASTTASAIQVRQKVYTDSIGSWKRLGSEINWCIDTLNQAGIRTE